MRFIKKMPINGIGLDETDRRIILEYEENCRDSINKIAQRMGISKRVLEYRLGRLIKKGVIIGFAAVFDYSKLGYINHEVWMQLKSTDEEEKEKFIQYLVKNPDVGWVVECGGKFDCAIGIMAKESVTFSSILKKIIWDNPGIVLDYYILISTKIYSYPRSYLLEEESQAKRGKLFFSGPPEKVNLDKIDMKIIALMSKNAKMSAVEMAEKAGISPNTVRKRIESLEERKVIKGYKAIVQPSMLGLQNYELLVKTICISREQEEELEAYARSNPYLTIFIECLGEWDLNFAMDARDFAHFLSMLSEFRTKFAPIINDFDFVSIVNVRKFQYRIG